MIYKHEKGLGDFVCIAFLLSGVHFCYSTKTISFRDCNFLHVLLSIYSANWNAPSCTTMVSISRYKFSKITS